MTFGKLQNSNSQLKLKSMKKPYKNKKAVTLIAFIGCFCLCSEYSVYAKEPYYHNKALSDWLSRDVDGDAQSAIEQMGTNTIPTLLEILGATPKSLGSVVNRLDSKVMQNNLCEDEGDVYFGKIKENVDVAFAILGTNAEAAAPELMKLLEEDKEDVSLYAASALGNVGPKGLSALTNAITSNNPSVRANVAIGISESVQGSKYLLQMLSDSDSHVRAVTAESLVKVDPTLAIPVLISALEDKDPNTRLLAAASLSFFGGKSENAADKIATLYINSQDRRYFEYLKRIDLGTAKKAEALVISSGPMNINHHGYTKTTLKTGLQLIAGGTIATEFQVPSNSILSSAEIYDPKTREWSETGKMTTARDGHSAVLLANGKVLVAGGFSEHGLLSTAELYDPATGIWSPTGSLNKRHCYASMVLRTDGKAMIYVQPSNSEKRTNVELYDPISELWTATNNEAKP